MKRYKTSSRLLAMLLSLLLVIGLFAYPMPAIASSNGNVIDMSDDDPSTSGEGWTYSNGVYTISDGANVIVVGDNGGSGRRILIEAGATVTVTLSGTSITQTNSNAAPIGLDNNTNLTLVLAEGTDNTLSGANTQASGIQMGLAGQATVTSTLTIEGTGTLHAIGGERWPGIGGRAGGSRTINIMSGTIFAQGGSEGAGIGNGRSTPADSNFVNIYGGEVTANGGGSAAGIGGGFNNLGADNAGIITVYGGLIKAQGGSGGAGIGSGAYNFSGGTLKLSGNGIVFASSISDTGSGNKTSGVLFQGNSGTVYGDVILGNSFEIASGKQLTIPDNTSLTITAENTMTNYGTIQNNGTLAVNLGGAYAGTTPSGQPIRYQIVQDIDTDSCSINPSIPEYVESGDDFTFSVNINEGFSKTADFAVKINGAALNEQDGKYRVTVTEPVAITVEGVEDIVPVIEGVINGATYYTSQSVTVVDTNLQSVTLNGKPVKETFSLQGNTNAEYIISATDEAGNKTEYTVIMKPIASIAASIEGITADNVTSKDQRVIETVKAEIEAVNTEYATEDEKAELNKILDNCDSLLIKIEESTQAGNTEIIDKVENITSDNVKLEDKEDLVAAKEDLENALENFGDNYTEEEKAEIQNKLDQISNALESIEKAETVENIIAALPDAVEPDDTDAEALIHAAKEQYDALTDHEKSLISNELKPKLESLLNNLVDYQIIEGEGSQWTVGDDGSLTITANGPVEKFLGIEVDGKAVDAANYTVKSGSTIITLKPAYLDTLSVGKHTLTVLYTDGETSGVFEVLGNSETTIPETGDNSNVSLWIILMFIAACGFTGTMVYGRKKKYSK